MVLDSRGMHQIDMQTGDILEKAYMVNTETWESVEL